jgi:hypothetical protein
MALTAPIAASLPDGQPPPIPTGESQFPPSDSAREKRIDVLLSWREVYHERIARLIFFVFIVAGFYVYYTVLAPRLGEQRLSLLEQASEDMDMISAQFRELRVLFVRFAEQADPSHAYPVQQSAFTPMMEFKDTIVDRLQSYLKRPTTTVKDKERLQIDLTRVAEAIDELSDLYIQTRNDTARTSRMPGTPLKVAAPL